MPPPEMLNTQSQKSFFIILIEQNRTMQEKLHFSSAYDTKLNDYGDINIKILWWLIKKTFTKNNFSLR